MSDTLPPLPCPFCGSDKIEYDDGDESSHYRCRNCGACSGRVYYTDAENSSDDYSASDAAALEAWNRRAALAAAVAEPVAWDWLRGVMDGIPTREERIGGQREKYVAKEAVMGWLHEGQSRAKLAAPPQREREPRTDEQVECATCEGDGRLTDPAQCARCGYFGCGTVECHDCGGSGISAPASAPKEQA